MNSNIISLFVSIGFAALLYVSIGGDSFSLVKEKVNLEDLEYNKIKRYSKKNDAMSDLVSGWTKNKRTIFYRCAKEEEEKAMAKRHEVNILAINFITADSDTKEANKKIAKEIKLIMQQISAIEKGLSEDRLVELKKAYKYYESEVPIAKLAFNAADFLDNTLKFEELAPAKPIKEDKESSEELLKKK